MPPLLTWDEHDPGDPGAQAVYYAMHSIPHCLAHEWPEFDWEHSPTSVCIDDPERQGLVVPTMMKISMLNIYGHIREIGASIRQGQHQEEDVSTRMEWCNEYGEYAGYAGDSRGFSITRVGGEVRLFGGKKGGRIHNDHLRLRLDDREWRMVRGEGPKCYRHIAACLENMLCVVTSGDVHVKSRYWHCVTGSDTHRPCVDAYSWGQVVVDDTLHLFGYPWRLGCSEAEHHTFSLRTCAWTSESAPRDVVYRDRRGRPTRPILKAWGRVIIIYTQTHITLYDTVSGEYKVVQSRYARS
ncbi:hypothetical protein KIPB_002914 [Kipferlia bialata]|uniref:Uncharacterized protein n=1 Tax=Kipferlia bialata TaxID=797122 RepID=A0A9K3CSZ4_9EUKA|nr:hypothetical protein KIPB_002914 [Kipferlia bialata]|eukprot:g2914.t1